MKKIFNKQLSSLIICFASIVILFVSFITIFVMHANAQSNLAMQQQWTSDKGSFDRAFEIAVSDKETPDKTLYIPNLKDQLGNNIDQLMQSIGNNASIVSTRAVGAAGDKIVNETTINLTNEVANLKFGTTQIIADTDKNGKIRKISFMCNISSLGYKALSFADLINNEHLVEKSFNEAGLFIDEGSVVLPVDKSSYTTYDSDGTTVIREHYDFSGKVKADGRNYSWSSSFDVDYSMANQKGNLSDTVRLLTISIEN